MIRMPPDCRTCFRMCRSSQETDLFRMKSPGQRVLLLAALRAGGDWRAETLHLDLLGDGMRSVPTCVLTRSGGNKKEAG